MRSKKVVVVGSGVVGTATGLGLASRGHDVVFSDVAPERMELLRKRGFDVVEPWEMARVRADAYLLSVPTPTGEDGRVDLSYLGDATRTVASAVATHPGWPVVVVRSTVPPGTTEDVVIATLQEGSGRTAGVDFGVCMNPEFLRAATANDDFIDPKVIVIGAIDQRSHNALWDLYAPWSGVPLISTTL